MEGSSSYNSRWYGSSYDRGKRIGYSHCRYAISVKSYNHQTQAEPRVIKPPIAELTGDGSGVLIIDDLVDTGKTLEAVRSMMPKAHVATIYAKPLGRNQVDTFVTEVSQDTWIFFPWDMALHYVEPYRGTD